jgi:hypothetical protein
MLRTLPSRPARVFDCGIFFGVFDCGIFSLELCLMAAAVLALSGRPSGRPPDRPVGQVRVRR